MKLTTEEMITALATSENENVASKCTQILKGTLTINEAKKYVGGFLLAVLTGNFDEAMARADGHNLLCLKIALNKKELNS